MLTPEDKADPAQPSQNAKIDRAPEDMYSPEFRKWATELQKPIPVPKLLEFSKKVLEDSKKLLESTNDPKPVSNASSLPRCVPPSLPPETQFPKDLRDAENEKIRARRRLAQSQIIDSRSELPDRIGLALSGGGIRSATFCLGVLQALAARKWIRKLDYLSTVSGGGYVGSFLGRMFTRDWVTKENPKKPDGLKEWPAGVDKAVGIKEEGYAAKRVESVLDDHRSAPLQWLRESGRYLSPTGSGDLLLAGAVAFRNWVAVLVVVITTLLATFLLGTTVRASLWYWEFWRTKIETPLMLATDHHWWWSPVLILPAVVFLLFALPLGWAYWLTQKDRSHCWEIPPWFTVAVILFLDGLAVVFPEWVGLKTPFVPAAVGIAVSLTLVCYSAAIGKRQGISALLGFLVLAGGIAAQRFMGGIWMRVPTGVMAVVGFVYLCWCASLRDQNRFNVMRNNLSRWFATAFIGMAVLLIFAVVDSFGQMAYALLRPDNGPGLNGLLGVTGLITLFGLAPRVKLLLDQLPDHKMAQMPISVVAGVAAVVLAGVLLVSVSAVANGFVWQWSNPSTTTTVSTSNVGCDPGCPATNIASSANVSVATNIIPAINLSQQLHGKSRVELTAQSLIQVVDKTDNAPSPLACRMSATWVLCACVACLLLAFCFGHTLTFLNLSSHQALYAARISRAYQGASNPERWFGRGQRLGEALPSDDAFWSDYKPHEGGGPLHIANVTLNETVSGKSQIEYRDRQGMVIAVGPAGLTVGTRFHALWKDGEGNSASVETIQPISTVPQAKERKEGDSAPWAGPSQEKSPDAVNVAAFAYHPLYGGKVNSKTLMAEQIVERLSLRQWIGISGAAFTTGLGKGTSVSKSLLLGLANIRLGYWWDSYIKPGDRKQTSRRDYVEGNPIRELLANIFPVQAHLLDEFLAKFRGPNSRLWYLSDGGHFENTGAYELIRRRVPCIIVCDCGCDTDYTFEDLGQLVRMVRVDFGAEIEFLEGHDLDALEPGGSQKVFGSPDDFAADSSSSETGRTEGDTPESGAAGGQTSETKSRKQPHALLARVWYPDLNSEPHKGGCSLLVVLKPSLSGDEPLDVAYYKSAYPEFPQETTLDQFFDEAQWESYRKLGRHIGEQVFPQDGEPAWFTKLAPWTS